MDRASSRHDAVKYGVRNSDFHGPVLLRAWIAAGTILPLQGFDGVNCDGADDDEDGDFEDVQRMGVVEQINQEASE